MRESYLVFGSPLIEQDEIDEVVSTLKSGWIGTGPKVAKFEEEFSKYVGAKYAIAVSSCTAGLHLAVDALDLHEGDEVIVPTLTFAASSNAVIHSGATPVFADVDKELMTIDLEDVVRKITPKTKAIIPVHFAGRAVNIDKLRVIADKYNLHIIHDAAHAIETEFKGKRVGSYDDITAYSFYVNKNLTTAEGGMVTTNNEELANKIKINALHGMTKDAWKRFSDDGYKHYQIVYPGFKYNMTDLQASLGMHQIGKVERFAKQRDMVWSKYSEELKDLPLILPSDVDENGKHAHHLYTILLDIDNCSITRDQLINELHKRKIGTGVHYIALHLQPYYVEKFGYKRGDFPNAEFISDRTISLPLSQKMTKQDANDVIEALHEILG